MKKYLLAAAAALLCLALLPRMSAGQIGFLIQEADGSPSYRNPRGLVFQNGSLSDTRGLITVSPVFSSAVTMAGDLTGDGGDQLFGFLQNQIASTTTTLTAAQCGSTIINDSADVVTLPEASTVLGCRYTFVVANASNLDINPNDATDLILPFINAVATSPTLISPSAGDAIRCATVGGSITLEAVGANAWAVVGGVAGHTWSDIN